MAVEVSDTINQQAEASQAQQDLEARTGNEEGYCECEVIGDGPVAFESDYKWKKCTKNNGYSNFKVASEFNMEDLPENYQIAAGFQWIRDVIAMTVRLTVAYVSEARPDGFYLSNLRGSKQKHLGSGKIHGVLPQRGPCQCYDCALSSSPSQEWYELYLVTACHVVYDSEEAKNTTVDFFYDDEKARTDGRMKTVRGWNVKYTDIADDLCEFRAVTHSRSFAKQLMVCTMQSAPLSLHSVYKPLTELECLCLIVSHPHGQPKKVTVGKMRSHRDGDTGNSFIMYTTDTCPGSSGGPVFLMYVEKSSAFLNSLEGMPLHSKWLPVSQVNMSGIGFTQRWWFTSSHP